MAVRKNNLIIEWDLNERERFKELINEIKKRSESLALRIKDKVKENLKHIQQNLYIFEADALKDNNDGSF